MLLGYSSLKLNAKLVEICGQHFKILMKRRLTFWTTHARSTFAFHILRFHNGKIDWEIESEIRMFFKSCRIKFNTVVCYTVPFR